MDTYSVSSGTAVGNELAEGARSANQFRTSQNAILVGNVQQHLASDKSSKRSDTEFKVGMDSYGGAEALGGMVAISNKGGISGLASQTADNFRSAGNKISNLVAGPPPGKVSVATPPTESAQSSFLEESGNVMNGKETTADDVGSALNDASKGAQEGEDLTGLAKGLTSAVGDGAKFKGVADAGGVSRFLLNRVGGLTSDISLEVGGKALGGVGGAISAGQDIANFANTGHIFKKGESGWSEAGNITSMIGAGLDMASIAVPILAPLALATNVFSAVAGTIGTEQDDTKQISTDGKPPPQQALSVHPGWSAVGMTASVHQPSIA